MADSTDADTNGHFLGLLVPALIAFISGLVVNSFITVVNINDWWKGRSVTPVDHIVTSLGISRICLPCALTLYIIFSSLSLKSLYLYVTLIIMDAVYVFFINLEIWLTSLLTIVFCLRIANLHTRLFLYLRGVIVQKTVYFIVASVLLSTFNCLLPLLTAITAVTKGGTHNTTMNNVLMACTSDYIITFFIGALIPVLSYCISSVLLFTSLYLHTKRMKMSGNLTIDLGTYYSAMKLVSFTFLYYTIYFFGHLFSAFYYYFYCGSFVQLFIALEYLPALHSSYLIYRTAKLRGQMSKVLQSVNDFLFQRKDIETREEIEIVAH